MRTFENPVLIKKVKNTLLERYGVDNIQKIPEVSEISRKHQYENWRKVLRNEFPMKVREKEDTPLFRIDDDLISVYILKEVASVEFLKSYGHQVNKKFGKFHLSLGAVSDGILYQVLRFEKHKDHIILSDFGTRRNYFNPNYYSNLMNSAISLLGIEDFTCVVPRKLASPELISSLQLELISEGMYEVFWILDDSLKKVTIRDNIAEIKKKYDYITSDFLDSYIHKNRPSC